MNKLIAFLRLIRLQNLVLIALFMILLRYFIIYPIISNNHISPILTTISFTILIISTLLIAAGGYIINDYYDVETDKINKPQKVIISVLIDPQIALRIYLIISTLGLIGGIYIGLALTFILMIALLWLYSFRLKKIAIVGNLAIALLIWLSAFLVVSAELIYLPFISPQISSEIRLYCLGFGIFAAISTFAREIIKDIEDIEGDKATNCRTLPIITNIFTTKIIIVITELLMIAMVIFAYIFAPRITTSTRLSTYILLFIILPTFLVIVRTIMAQEKADFTKISNISKFVMLMGILVILII